MNSIPELKWVPLLMFSIIWAGFGVFSFVVIHQWGIEYDAKVEKIERGEVRAQTWQLIAIRHGSKSTSIIFQSEKGENITESGNEDGLSVGDQVTAYRLDNEWFIPAIHRGGHHWGKWVFLAFGLIPPLIAWTAWFAIGRVSSVTSKVNNAVES